MKPKTIILMVVAVVCGLGAAYMTSTLLAQRQVENVEVEKIKVIVAKKDLEIGINIKKDNLANLFTSVEMLKGSEPPDALTSDKDVHDKFLNRFLRKGDPVRGKDLVIDIDKLKLPKGQRAVGIRVTNESQVAGFASLPGNRIDILWYVRESQEGPQCLTLLQNVLVLAADMKYKRENGPSAIQARVVTVALTPDDTRSVTVAQNTGELRFVLRRADDDTSDKDVRTTYKEIFNKLLAKEKKKKQPSVAPYIPEPVTPVVEPKQQPQTVVAPPRPLFRPYLVDIVTGDYTMTQSFLQNNKGQIVRPEIAEYQRQNRPQGGLDDQSFPQSPPRSSEEDPSAPPTNPFGSAPSSTSPQTPPARPQG